MSALQSAEIKDFQSLKDVKVPFGRFTAIVGPSNTGKSAVVRALRLLARNGSGTGLVREGKTQLTATVEFADGAKVRIEKGSRVNRFLLREAGLDDAVEAETWAKVGLEVPPEIQALWSTPKSELGDLVFSTQHDAPFLLSSPPSAVAKAIGELTNASILMEAVREANRRRVVAVQDAAARNREVEEAIEEFKALQSLKSEKAILDAAEAQLAEADSIEAGRVRLAQAILQRDYQRALLSDAVEELKALRARRAAVDVVSAVAAAHASLAALLAEHRTVFQQIADAERMAEQWTLVAEQHRDEAHDLLTQNGVCPMCGGAVS